MKKLALLAIAFTLITSASSIAQKEARSINFPPVEYPGGALVVDENRRFVSTDIKGIAIVSIEVEGEPVTFGRSFLATEDWLRNLEVTIKNESDQPIKAIRMLFGLPETNAIKSTGFSFEYGRELSTGIDYGDQPMIAPGAEVKLVRNDRHYKRDAEGIARISGLSKFTQLVLASTQVKFEDDTLWMSYKLPIVE